MTHPDTKSIDEAHQQAVGALQSFLLDTAAPGTLDGLRDEIDAASSALDDLRAAVDNADENDAPDTYSGWAPATLTIPPTPAV